MLKVLIVGEKWAACNPEFGLSALHHNFIDSLTSTQLADVHTFFFDEYAHQNRQLCDEALLTLCEREKPDIVVLKMVRGTDLNPKLETLANLRQREGLKIASVHGDTHDQFAASWMEEVSNVVDLVLVQDCYSVYPTYVADTSKFFDVWTPQSPSAFYCNGDEERDIDVSFIGRVEGYTDRKMALGLIDHAGIDVLQKGGVSETAFSIEAYASYLRRSKIALNFSKPVFDEPNYQCKGRTLESALCGALLLEQKNPETPKWFRPGEDYVEFDNERDLIEKVRYYLSHEDDRQKIATRGHETATQNYSADKYWRLVLERLGAT